MVFLPLFDYMDNPNDILSCTVYSINYTYNNVHWFIDYHMKLISVFAFSNTASLQSD